MFARVCVALFDIFLSRKTKLPPWKLLFLRSAKETLRKAEVGKTASEISLPWPLIYISHRLSFPFLQTLSPLPHSRSFLQPDFFSSPSHLPRYLPVCNAMIRFVLQLWGEPTHSLPRRPLWIRTAFLDCFCSSAGFCSLRSEGPSPLPTEWNDFFLALREGTKKSRNGFAISSSLTWGKKFFYQVLWFASMKRPN